MAHDLHPRTRPAITPELMLRAYATGIFPMSDARHDPEIYWVDPIRRGVMPLDGFHLSRSLKRTIRGEKFDIRTNTAFDAVVAGCANRPETWINDELFGLYSALHAGGHAHSVETWADGRLVGGIYGITLGAAFFGESMFSEVRDASKVALTYLVARLNAGGFRLFDTQFLTPHLASLGGVEVARETYHARLQIALNHPGDFHALADPIAPQVAVQLSTQTS